MGTRRASAVPSKCEESLSRHKRRLRVVNALVVSLRNVLPALATLAVLAGAIAVIQLASAAGRPEFERYFERPPEYPGYQWTRDGRPAVRSYELGTSAGPAHCGWESATFLNIGWPVGTISRSAVEARQFIRDPNGSVSPRNLRHRLDLDAKLPGDATPTGYRFNELEIYFSPSDQDRAVYVVGPSRVERWPRSDPMTLCM